MIYTSVFGLGKIKCSASSARMVLSKPIAKPAVAVSLPPKRLTRSYAPPPQSCFSAPSTGASISKTSPL
jgi:hypothetical protein